MNRFATLKQGEMQEVNGGGIISAGAGALAGALLGAHTGMIHAAITRDASHIGRHVIMGASIGSYVGAGCPLP